MANEPMLLDLNDWGVDQVLWLPGQSGNYASIPDTNLFNAHQAHLKQVGLEPHQSPIDWNGNFNSNMSFVDYGDAFAGTALRIYASSDVATENSSVLAAWHPSRVKVTPGTEYSFSVAITEDAPSLMKSKIRLLWYVDNSTNTSGGPSVDSSFVDLEEGTETTISVNGTAPAGAEYASMAIYYTRQDGTGVLAGDAILAYNLCIRTGSDSTFVPSTRIVGDIDIVVKSELENLSTNQALHSKRQNFTSDIGWTLYAMNDGRLRFDWSTDGTDATDSVIYSGSSLPDYVIRNPVWYRVTLDVDNGSGGYTLSFYYSFNGTDWISLGETIGGTTTSIYPSSYDVHIGNYGSGSSPLKAALESSELRDGIDGPIVASVDFTDTTQASGDQFNSPEGHQVTINRSGDATAELVDRNAWAFNASTNYIRFPDRTEFHFNSGDDFSVASKFMTRSSGEWTSMMGNRGGTNQEGFDISKTSGDQFRFLIAYSDGAGTPNVGVGVTINDAQWHLAYGQRDSNGLLLGRIDSTEATGTTQDGDISAPTNDLHIGRHGAASEYWRGFISVALIFNRILTSVERDELSNWDGTVASEPTWLRDAAVLYVNADDPAQARQYRADYGVVNLAYDVSDDVSDTLYVRETLTTEDSTVTPSIDDFYIEIYPAVRDVEDEINPIEGTGYGGLKYAEEPALFRASGQSIRFDGDDDYVDISHIAPLYTDAPGLTLEAWINTTKTGLSAIYSHALTSSNNNYVLWYLNQGAYTFSINGTIASSGGAQYHDGLWHHALVTWHRDTGEIKYYLDGEEFGVDSGISTGHSLQSGGVVVLGQEQDTVGGGFDPAQAYEGLMDDFAVYNYVLSPSTVAQHYNIGWRGKYSLMQDGDTITIGADEVDTTDYAWQIIKG